MFQPSSLHLASRTDDQRSTYGAAKSPPTHLQCYIDSIYIGIVANLIELPILAVLAKQPMHGYDIRRLLSPMEGLVGAASYGSIYPMLKQLRKRGHIGATRGEAERGPERITYRITSTGRRRLAGLFADDKTAFALKLLFFGRASSRTRLCVLQKQRRAWAKQLESRRATTQAMADRIGTRYRQALLERMFDQLKRDIAWIDRLIAQAERS